MKKTLKRLFTGVLTLATVVTAIPTTAVHASETQYWTESTERIGIVEKVMNDGSIGSTFNEGHMKVGVDITVYIVRRTRLSSQDIDNFKTITHVAIYVGNGKVVKALNTKYGVVFQDVRTNNNVLICHPN